MGFWYDVSQTTVFHRFQQISTTIKTEMFLISKTLNCLTFWFKQGAADMDQLIDKIVKWWKKFCIFCSHHPRLFCEHSFLMLNEPPCCMKCTIKDLVMSHTNSTYLHTRWRLRVLRSFFLNFLFVYCFFYVFD